MSDPLENVIQVIEFIRKQRDDNPTDFPPQHITAFFKIAQKNSVTYKYLMDELNLSNASVSRIVNSLGTDPHHRKKGLMWVEKIIDQNEGRRHRVRLTPKGIGIFEQINKIVTNNDSTS